MSVLKTIFIEIYQNQKVISLEHHHSKICLEWRNKAQGAVKKENCLSLWSKLRHLCNIAVVTIRKAKINNMSLCGF